MMTISYCKMFKECIEPYYQPILLSVVLSIVNLKHIDWNISTDAQPKLRLRSDPIFLRFKWENHAFSFNLLIS